MFNSSLFDERTFYQQFSRDVLEAKEEIIIESPYISSRRMKVLYALFERSCERNIKIYIITRDPSEHLPSLARQSSLEIRRLGQIGVQVLLCDGSHHRKLAIIDRKVLWEGSLNILSQTKSIEIMRRIEGESYAEEMLVFSDIKKYVC